MICCPAYAFDEYKYHYGANNTHLIHATFKESENMLDYINNISSSDTTQVITKSAKNHGTVDYLGDEYFLIKSNPFICTVNKIIFKEGISNHSNFLEIPSKHSGVISYWKPDEPLFIGDSSNSIKVHGFINFDRCVYNKSIFSKMAEELSNIFQITKNGRIDKKIRINTCYTSRNIYRVMIFEASDDKRKPFWR